MAAKSSQSRADAGHLATWMEQYSTSLFRASAGTVKLQVSKPEPDVNGIDWLVSFGHGYFGVQLKSSYALRFNKQGTLQFPVEPTWVDGWHAQDIPPRLVLYILQPDPDTWWNERMSGEFHRAVPYWAVLDRSVSVPSVRIERTNRFTPKTLLEWGSELRNKMGGQP